MHGAEILIPILVPLAGCAMIFGIFYLKARENLAIIEKGMNPKQYANRPAPFRSLKTGLLLMGAGVGLLLAYIIDHSFQYSRDPEAIYFSLIAIGGGLGLIISYIVEKKEWLSRKDTDV